MSELREYGFGRKLLLRLEAAAELSWVLFKMKDAPWAWARDNLQPSMGRDDRVATIEIEKAAHSAASILPFTVLCVPVTVAAMRMLRRRGISANVEWTPPGVKSDRGHVRVGR